VGGRLDADKAAAEPERIARNARNACTSAPCSSPTRSRCGQGVEPSEPVHAEQHRAHEEKASAAAEGQCGEGRARAKAHETPADAEQDRAECQAPVDRAKVLGFLDFFGDWDPSLALVMASPRFRV